MKTKNKFFISMGLYLISISLLDIEMTFWNAGMLSLRFISCVLGGKFAHIIDEEAKKDKSVLNFHK